MSVPSRLDHVVIAGPELAAVIAHVERATGVRAAPGGRHPGLGTANALIALTRGGERGPQYLELIGPDPDRGGGAPAPTAFGIDGVTEPRVVAYAIHPTDLDGAAARARDAGLDPGPVVPLSRRTDEGELLEWRLTHWRPDLPAHLPFLIDWGGTPHPGTTTVPTLELDAFTATVPDVWAACGEARAFGSDIRLHAGAEASLRLEITGRSGRVTLA